MQDKYFSYRKLNRFILGSVFLIIAVDAIWIILTHRSLVLSSFISFVAGVSFFCIICKILVTVYRHKKFRDPVQKDSLKKIITILHAFILMVIYVKAVCLLEYLLIATNQPLVDEKLDLLDKLIGFNWLTVYEWVIRHPLIESILRLVYSTMIVQASAIILFLSLLKSSSYLREFLSVLIIVVMLTLIISGFFPAQGTFARYGIHQASYLNVNDFDILRSGVMSVFDIEKFQGLVSMPSFHAASGFLFIYILRFSRILFLISLLLNGIMIFATLIIGGHYLVDVIAGGIVTGASILVTHTLFKR